MVYKVWGQGEGHEHGGLCLDWSGYTNQICDKIVWEKHTDKKNCCSVASAVQFSSVLSRVQLFATP